MKDFSSFYILLFCSIASLLQVHALYTAMATSDASKTSETSETWTALPDNAGTPQSTNAQMVIVYLVATERTSDTIQATINTNTNSYTLFQTVHCQTIRYTPYSQLLIAPSIRNIYLYSTALDLVRNAK